jgi:hypothetical protein
MSNDKKAIQKLNAQKKANKTERVQRRLAGNDSAKTRDGGTSRRTWLDPKQGR